MPSSASAASPEFEASLGIAKNILSDRLEKLVDHGIFEKERLDEPGTRYGYALTAKGRDLWLILTALRLWSDKWVYEKGEAPLHVQERDSGRRVAGLLAVDRSGKAVDPSQLEWVFNQRRGGRRRTGAR